MSVKMRAMIYLPTEGEEFLSEAGEPMGVTSYPIETEVDDEMAEMLRDPQPKRLVIEVTVIPIDEDDEDDDAS